MIDQEEIPNKLKMARVSRGFSRQKVADALQVHVRTLSYWENGDTDIPLSRAVALANFYDVSIAELIGDIQFEAAMLELRNTNQRLKRMEEILERLERRD